MSPSSTPSTGSARPSRHSSTWRRCSSWSASRCARRSRPTSCTSHCSMSRRQMITFPYHSEDGRRDPQDDHPARDGPYLADHARRASRCCSIELRNSMQLRASEVGTPAKSWLGVPIVVGDEAIGVISVQSTQPGGRFGPDDVRLLDDHRGERRDGDPERPALPRDRTATRPRWRPSRMSGARSPRRSIRPRCWNGSSNMRCSLLAGRSSAVFLAEPDGRTFRRSSRCGPDRRRAQGRHHHVRAGDHRRRRSRQARPSTSTTS